MSRVSKFPTGILSASELKQLRKLSTPAKIQDFLDSLPMNFSDDDPCYSVRDVLKKKTAHCFEGALLAAAALWLAGQRPLLLDLTTTSNDEDHVVAVVERAVAGKKYWGAISKTNHAVLRYREPVYRSVRELAMSYFHEYFLDTGEKTLRTYSDPFDLSKHMGMNWLASRGGIMDLIQALADSRHHPIITAQQIKTLRPADAIEIKAGQIVEWKNKKR